jgi:hypothetical protein
MSFFGLNDRVLVSHLLLNIMGALHDWSDGWEPNRDWGPIVTTQSSKPWRESLRALENAACLESTFALITHDETRRQLSTANERRALQLLDGLTPERPELQVMYAQILLGVAATLPAGATRAAVLKRAVGLVGAETRMAHVAPGGE